VIEVSSDRTTQPAAASERGWRQLQAIVATIALLWLIVLPAIGKLDAMQAAIQEREAQGIDTGAMFYTDLERMDDVLAKSKQFHGEHPDALWVPGRLR
jgi:hypothetical protein